MHSNVHNSYEKLVKEILLQLIFLIFPLQIVSFIVLRNLPGWLRKRYSVLFAWFGKISLEVSEAINILYLNIIHLHIYIFNEFASSD